MSEATMAPTNEPGSVTVIPAPPKNLATKILEIQKAVGAVKKRGKFGSEMGGSNFLRIEDAVAAVGGLMSERGLILTGSLATKSNGDFFYERIPHTTKGYIVNVVTQWKLEDVESGVARVYYLPGDGYDGTDKAVYKALTGSRKYAVIQIFNLAVGNDVEAHGTPTFEEGKDKQKAVAANKIAAAAAQGNKAAIDALSQVEHEKKVTIARPEEYNGHYIIASGYVAVPALDTFFTDTGCKRIDSRKTGKTGWKVPSEYEKGLLGMCEKLGLEVEG